MSTNGCPLFLWEVDFFSLTKCIFGCEFLVIQYWHPAYNHHIVFHFRREGRKLLALKSIADNQGKLKMKPEATYRPYPRDLRKLINEAYDYKQQDNEASYFIYDPMSTLMAFNVHCKRETPENRETIRRKLIADTECFHNPLCWLVKKEMKTGDLFGWIAANTSTVPLKDEWEYLVD